MPRCAAMWFVVTASPPSRFSSSTAPSRMRATVPPARLPLGRPPAETPLDSRVPVRVFALAIGVFTLAQGVRHVDRDPLRRSRRLERMGRVPGLQDDLSMGVRRRARVAAPAVREGQAAAVERGRADRLVTGARSGEPRAAARRVDADLRLRALPADDPWRAGAGSHALPGLAAGPGPPW